MTAKGPVGRPRALTQALKTEICERIALGETLREITRRKGMPAARPSARRCWRTRSFRTSTCARELPFEEIEDELLEIADDGSNDWVEKRNAQGELMGWAVNGEHIQRSRARQETRKWLMSKRAPKKYGDRIEQTIASDPDKPIEAVQRTFRFIVKRPGE